jgi:hypothetical protein
LATPKPTQARIQATRMLSDESYRDTIHALVLMARFQRRHHTTCGSPVPEPIPDLTRTVADLTIWHTCPGCHERLTHTFPDIDAFEKFSKALSNDHVLAAAVRLAERAETH